MQYPFGLLQGLFGGGVQPGYQPDQQTLGLLGQLNRGPDGMPSGPAPNTNELFKQLNRGYDGMPTYGILNQPQSQYPGSLPIFSNADVPPLNAMPAGPAQVSPPIPPVRPPGLGVQPPASTPAPAAPIATPPSAPAQQPKQEPGFLDKLGTLAGSIYGGGQNPGDNLIALGAGLMSGPNAGAGLMKGMAMVNANALTGDKRALEREQAKQKLLGLSGNMQMLRRAFPGKTDAEYAAMSQQPQIIQEALKRTEGAFTGQPQLVDVQNPDGSTTKQWISPGQASGQVVSTTPAPPGLPQGADPEAYRKGLSQKAADKQQSDADKREAGDSVMPYIDRAHAAYKRLGELNAIGPFYASTINRTIGGSFGTEAEKLRQDYEAAAKHLELTQARIMMKGQGQITENERKILQMTLPRLDAADPATGLRTLEMLRNDFVRAGRGQQQQQGRTDPLGIR